MTLLHLVQRLFALVSLAVLAAGGYLVWSWFDRRDDLAEAGLTDEASGQPWRLYLGLGLLAWSFLGRPVMLMLLARPGRTGDRYRRGKAARVTGADGSEVFVDQEGPAEAPALVMIHGWGMDGTTWRDLRRSLALRYETLALDLPGLGRSKGPKDGRYSLDRFADDLRAVLELAGRKQVVLVGHSIGGMIVQTFCRRHPDLVGDRVAGIVLVNTTHTNPTRTTALHGVLTALQPILEPAMRLDVVLSPVIRLLNWQSYLSGWTHLGMRLTGFGARPDRAQLDQAAFLPTRNSPAVQAKGNLAMMHWDVTEDLPRMRVPALVVIGGRDLVTLPEAGETIGQRLPLGGVVRIAAAGHMGPMELANDYARAISAFADQVFTRGARSADAPNPSFGSNREGQAFDEPAPAPGLQPRL